MRTGDADFQAAQLLAGFGGAGFAPPTSKPQSAFRPLASTGRAQPLPSLARVAEEGGTGGGGTQEASGAFTSPVPAATPPQLQRSHRPAVTPLTAGSAIHLQQYQHSGTAGGGSPIFHELPPLQSPLPPPNRNAAPLRGPLSRSETADSYTSQTLRSFAAQNKGSSKGVSKHDSLFVGPSRPRTAAARALLAGTSLHPVVRLGWDALCEVHCNGLTGFFLGGHDRDLYIKCTAPEYANLHMVDVSQGGCIMTCSHFEKAAGRELSKKWKESIHVAGEGEGSKATLVAWLKRRAEAEYGAAVVGRTVWVCWCADAEYYLGEIISYSRENGKHKVKYSDRFVEELHLPVEKLDFGPTKPVITFDPADCGFSDMAQRQVGEAGGGISRSRSAPAATLRSYAAGLLHQCSNVSTSCEFHDHELLGTGAKPERRSRLRDGSPPQHYGGATSPANSDEGHTMLPPPVAVSRRRRTGAVSPEVPSGDAQPPVGAPGIHRTSSSISEESDGTPVGPAPKKRRSGGRTSGELNARLAEAAVASMGAPAHPASPLHLDKRIGSFSTWLPDDKGAELATPAAASKQSLADRSPPPAAGHGESSVATMSRWMNRVAMAVEDKLRPQSAQAAQAALRDARADADGTGSGAGTLVGWGMSPSGRFQALLVAARHRGCLQAHYEAMLERYDFFKDEPALLNAKMADYIMAALYQDGIQQSQGRPDREGSRERSTGEATINTAEMP